MLQLFKWGNFLDLIRDVPVQFDRARFHNALFGFLEGQAMRLKQAVGTLFLDDAMRAILDIQSLSLLLATKFVLYKQDLPEERCESWRRLVDVQEFFCGQLGSKGMHFAVLDVLPLMSYGDVQMPSQDDLKRAFHAKAKKFHADKQHCHADWRKHGWAHLQRPENMMKKVNAAREFLSEESNCRGFGEQLASLFWDKLRSLQEHQHLHTNKLLEEQRYDRLKAMLDNIKKADQELARRKGVPIDDLFTSIQERLVDEVRKVKVEVDTKWREGGLRELHEELSKLKMINKELATYPTLVPEDLIKGISEQVNEKVSEEGLNAQKCITRCVSLKDAMEQLWQFGGHLLFLGQILSHLGDFKVQAEVQVVRALNICYEKTWGASFLFELGMRLGQGKIGDPKTDATIGKVLLNNFRHFEDVHTVIFNRETRATQKAVTETLKATLPSLARFASRFVSCCVSWPRFIFESWLSYNVVIAVRCKSVT